MASFGYAHGQNGGTTTFNYTNLTPPARIAALGGHFISVRDDDLNLAYQNPAQLNSSMSNQLALNFVPYVKDVKYGNTAYAYQFPKAGTFAAGIMFIDYGTFDRSDVTGFVDGTFHAAEYAFNVSWSKPLDSLFSIGASVKGLYSKLEEYSSTGAAADIGISYSSRNSLFGFGVLVKNIGRQIDPYIDGNKEDLPFEIQGGLTKRLQKAPFRFTLTLQHLQKFDITYTDPAKENEVDPLTGETTFDEPSFFEKALLHAVISAEILLNKNFHLRVGYNYKRRQELGYEEKMSIVGFTGGFGLKISKFRLSYGRAVQHLGAGSNHISISTAFSEFRKKKE
jgi:hypothetical protein